MPGTAAPRPNQALRAVLTRARMSPRELIRATNQQLEARGHNLRLHETAAYPWLNTSAVPHSPAVRDAAATVLGRATGTTYRAHQLWPTAPDAEPTPTAELTGRRSLPTVLDLTESWAALTPAQHSDVPPLTAGPLTTSALDALASPPPRRRRGSGDRVQPPMAAHIEATLADLRRLDDQTGGNAIAQRWVNNLLASVIDLLRHASYSPDTGQRLLRTAAGLAQLAGWTAFDSTQLGSAQRYHLLALRLGSAADATDILANNLGMLAYQSASSGQPAAALRLATAAVDITRRAHPAVRARALGRLATAHAAGGDLHAHRAAADACRDLLARLGPDDTPEDLYYFTPRQLAAETGHALVLLASAYPAHAKSLLAEAVDLLAPLAIATADDDTYRRSALLHGIHLARAYDLARDRQGTAATTATLAARLPAIQSLRCRAMLRDLRRDAGTRLPRGTREALDKELSPP